MLVRLFSTNLPQSSHSLAECCIDFILLGSWSLVVFLPHVIRSYISLGICLSIQYIPYCIKSTTIVDNKPAYNIRVILGKKRGADGLATWLANNKDKSKVGNITYQALQEQTYVNGLYFYVRDEKVLQLITLICGDNIRKIERLVWHEEIDKYKYGNE